VCNKLVKKFHRNHGKKRHDYLIFHYFRVLQRKILEDNFFQFLVSRRDKGGIDKHKLMF
jgi:hypothetical protein